MISLTFVRISNCSHGTVGRTTGFRSGRYGFESQPLHTCFNFSSIPEDRDTPLSCIRSLETRIFLKLGMVPPPHEIFRYCVTKNFRQKIVMPPSFARKYSIPDFFWNTEGFSHEFFRTVRQKNSQRKIVISLSYAWHFSIPEIFLYTEVFPNEIFRYCETKYFELKVVIPPLLH